MSRPNPYAELNNRDSAIVQSALKRRCGICKRVPGDFCINTVAIGSADVAMPLPGGRLVHIERTAA